MEYAKVILVMHAGINYYMHLEADWAVRKIRTNAFFEANR